MSNPRETEQSEMWRTADGQVLRVADMESTHLLNAMAMLRRKAADLFVRDKELFDTPPACSLMDGMKPSDLLPPIYKAMARELKARNQKIEIRPQGRKLQL